MKVLIVGANGYIGLRLMVQLLAKKATVYALVRNPQRVDLPEVQKAKIHFLQGDLLKPQSLPEIPPNLDVAFYLVHSMSQSHKDFERLERQCAQNFLDLVENKNLKQLVYLGGIYPKNELSTHLNSRYQVEQIFDQSSLPTTLFRAGIIIGSGSASFEMIRDLTEKLPIMVAPRWIKNLIQPIAVRDVLRYLVNCVGKKNCKNQIFEIGGEEKLTYRDLMYTYAKVRGLKRWIFTVPVLSLKLSSYWLYLVTSVNFSLARSLVESLKTPLYCQDSRVKEILPMDLTPLEDALRQALKKIEDKEVVSSWKDAWSVGQFSNKRLEEFVSPPQEGCFKDRQSVKLKQGSEQEVCNNFFAIGGEKGWYYWNWAWHLRGFLDLCFGGTGLNRGRTQKRQLIPGDVVDFWRVIIANKEKRYLLLYSEMKLPGEAWLEFKIENQHLVQTATFRPLGVTGRLYWYALFPFHLFIFSGMAKNLSKTKEPPQTVLPV